jgi:hypothetical protein
MKNPVSTKSGEDSARKRARLTPTLAITMTGRTVAFLDILGFRKLVESRPTEELGTLFSAVIGGGLPAMNRPFGEPHNEPVLLAERPSNGTWCISHAFSDSIILISHDESESSALALLVFALRVTQMLIASKLPIRGAIAYDEMYVDTARALFLGKALTRAYALEQAQHWIGVAIDPSVPDRFPNLLESDVPLPGLRKCLFPRYEVPMKTGPIHQLHTLNWRWNMVAEVGTRALFTDEGDWSARTKIEAALTYALEMRKSGRAYPADDRRVPIEVRRF